jgi:hypothetical protein
MSCDINKDVIFSQQSVLKYNQKVNLYVNLQSKKGDNSDKKQTKHFFYQFRIPMKTMLQI